MAKKIGVVLSGCGVYDGAEIHESVLTLLALDRRGASAVLCAPDTPQMHVVNHLSGQVEEGASRNVLVESARIARGAIRDLATVKADELDGLVLPGGFGAAKNLCDFAVKGADCSVHPEVARLVREVHAQGKPVGAVCIAPVLVAKVLGKERAEAHHRHRRGDRQGPRGDGRHARGLRGAPSWRWTASGSSSRPRPTCSARASPRWPRASTRRWVPSSR